MSLYYEYLREQDEMQATERRIERLDRCGDDKYWTPEGEADQQPKPPTPPPPPPQADQPPPLPARLSSSERRFRARELRRWTKQRESTTPAQWAEKVGRIPSPSTRAGAACVLFYDLGATYRGIRDALLTFMREYDLVRHARAESIRKALIGLGYPEYIAAERIYEGNR